MCLRASIRSYTAIYEEYTRFAGKKGRTFDLQFIELFDTRLVEVAVRRIRQKDAEEQARLSRDVAGSVVGSIVERALSPA
eukprot:COSAG06_NODE_7597_length_2446_cov_76.957171_3_plen_80_part_00